MDLGWEVTVRSLLPLLLVQMSWSLWAQLSPGDLTRSHAHLEGILNCTKCHDLGKGISETKCLECHDLLQDRINQGLGFHAASEVTSQSCITCHSDHHGRDFEIIRFDETSFDHELTGYSLVGAHAQQDCKACHNPTFIASPEIREKEYTFLGLETECLACHEDVHQGTLSQDCATCHDFEAFAPASFFDHDDTTFPLKGKHKEVDCLECHPRTLQNDLEFQEFASVAHANCTSCHEDVHQNKFGQQCTQCHNENSWYQFHGMDHFDHNQTRFALRGQHRQTNCFSCHKDGTDNAFPFQEFTQLRSFACTQCHEDVHQEKLGSDCRLCHDEHSFTLLIAGHTFDHDGTDYALEGKHAGLDCALCHQESKITPLPHARCDDCHDDFHEGAFIRDNVSRDCAECHTVHNFTETSYTIDQHNAGVFPLLGAHLATPCFACHLQDSEWQFHDIGSRCIDCHEDIHIGLLSERYYPNQACDKCHQEEGWNLVDFDHTQTNFMLEGKHLQTSCNDCHFTPGIPIEHQQFFGLSSRCVDCHEDIHRGQFDQNGFTDCTRCHAFADWQAVHFNHDSTRFVLEGAHLEIDCKACHKETTLENQTYTVYRIEDFACASCHL